jgi:hypothetical protein
MPITSARCHGSYSRWRRAAGCGNRNRRTINIFVATGQLGAEIKIGQRFRNLRIQEGKRMIRGIKRFNGLNINERNSGISTI